MKVDQFNYDLPEELIAQHPLQERASSRLMVLSRESGELHHRQFTQFQEFVQAGDVLVVNDTKVIPARLLGTKKETGAKIELLLLNEVGPDQWEVLVKPGKRVKVGTKIEFGSGRLEAEVLRESESGGRLVCFSYQGIFQQLLDELGQMPLPPYIKKQLDDPERYQTVFARQPGSAAAPTAGLHLTPEMLTELRENGVSVVPITLHIGLGTFRPVQVEDIERHHMHREYYEISDSTAKTLNQAKRDGRRVIAVGTTVCRTLETAVRTDYPEMPFTTQSGWTDIFIYPGYTFSAIDGLVTNFHLPKSTLLMLVAAFGGYDEVLHAYKCAVDKRYRFFSFGDAMFII